MEWFSLIPDQKDFHALDIANKAYPRALKQDTEGRISNKALPVVTRILRRQRGIIEVRPLVFWADYTIFNNK